MPESLGGLVEDMDVSHPYVLCMIVAELGSGRRNVSCGADIHAVVSTTCRACSGCHSMDVNRPAPDEEGGAASSCLRYLRVVILGW